MVKLRKQRRRKVYRHNVNRKRLRNKLNNPGSIGCKDVKDAWDHTKSIPTNMKAMGLSYDPNDTIKIPNSKQKYKASIMSNEESEWQEEDLEEENQLPDKTFVVNALEADAKAPRVKKFRLPNSVLEWVKYLLKKYGNDYKAMARDRKNYNQETWKQIRQKIRTFKKIPEQSSEFLKEIGMDKDDDVNMSDDEL